MSDKKWKQPEEVIGTVMAIEEQHLFKKIGKEIIRNGFVIFTKRRRFANVSCSQCGREFGPGDSGYSHCKDHES